jgi:hypothetical protein
MSKKLMMTLAVGSVLLNFAPWSGSNGIPRSIDIANALASKPTSSQPKTGVVKQMIMGDVMCYVDLTDLKGKPHHLGADFSVCTKTRRFLGKKVRVSYKKMRVNDCQSAEPCGKTKVERVIYKMQVVR